MRPYNSRRNRSFTNKGATLVEMMIAVIFVTTIAAVLGGGCVAAFVKNDYQGILNSTERVCRGSGDSQICNYEWRFRGTNGYHDEVFVNMDSLVNAKFNSADFQNSVDVGQEYRLVVTGWRVPFLSMFRNVIRVTPVRNNKEEHVHHRHHLWHCYVVGLATIARLYAKIERLESSNRDNEQKLLAVDFSEVDWERKSCARKN